MLEDAAKSRIRDQIVTWPERLSSEAPSEVLREGVQFALAIRLPESVSRAGDREVGNCMRSPASSAKVRSGRPSGIESHRPALDTENASLLLARRQGCRV